MYTCWLTRMWVLTGQGLKPQEFYLNAALKCAFWLLSEGFYTKGGCYISDLTELDLQSNVTLPEECDSFWLCPLSFHSPTWIISASRAAQPQSKIHPFFSPFLTLFEPTGTMFSVSAFDCLSGSLVINDCVLGGASSIREHLSKGQGSNSNKEEN